MDERFEYGRLYSKVAAAVASGTEFKTAFSAAFNRSSLRRDQQEQYRVAVSNQLNGSKKRIKTLEAASTLTGIVSGPVQDQLFDSYLPD